MRTIHSDFKQFCIDNISSEDRAQKVSSFYRKYIKVTGVKSSLEAKKKNIKAVLYNYNEEALIIAIDDLLDMERRGTMKDLTLPYFEKCVENKFNDAKRANKANEPFQKKVTSPIPINKSTVLEKINTPTVKKGKVIPIIDKRLNAPWDDNIPVQENFIFKCPECNNTVPGFTNFCTNCNIDFNYNEVDFTEFTN